MAKQISVLIVDDDEEFVELVEDALDMQGFTVYTATGGAEGLKLARKKKPDVVLLDVTMPEMDGLEVLRQLKNDGRTARIAVFMLTAKTIVDDIERAFDIGADDYITKPVELAQLGRLVTMKLDKFHKKK